MHNPPELVCFDLPCLVVPRSSTPAEALDRALRRLGVEPSSELHTRAMALDLRWPGDAARAALGALFGSDVWADAAAAAFDDAFGAAAARQGAGVADGAGAVVSQLRGLGTRVCITTEFSAATREAVLDVLEWSELVALLVSPAEADLSGSAVLRTALERSDVASRQAVVVSATPSGVTAGALANVGTVVGVPGTFSPGQLRQAGATYLSSLPQLAATWAGARLLPA
ncbi:MAG: hypothetical protein NVS3B26_29190 [Mycobacteriales bacterium]